MEQDKEIEKLLNKEIKIEEPKAKRKEPNVCLSCEG